MVITAASYAAPVFSRLTIVNAENKNLRVVIDGNRYDGIGSNLSLANLQVGYHNIKIYQKGRGFFSGDRLIYSSSIFMKPDRALSLIVGRGGEVAIREQSSRWDNDRYPDSRGRDQRDDRYGRDQRDRSGRDDRRNDNGYSKY